jgi:signal transduction histidine kinase
MLSDVDLRDPVLINTIGHTAGLLLFGFIILLLLRDWRAHGIRQTRRSLVAAALALAWNAGSLIALASEDQSTLLTGILMTASFSVLSLLPAVLLDVALQGHERTLVTGGYLVSTCAVLLHVTELLSHRIRLHQAALVLIAVGFGVLTMFAIFHRRRRPDQPNETSEWLSLACLVLFTSSFLHFGYQHVGSPWTAEITWHHIGIPVALIVLLQDYRFLLLDTFVRFLVNFGLATAYIATILVLNRRFRLWDVIGSSTFLTGIALVTLCVSLIFFAQIRNVLQAWLGRVIFRRQNVNDCVRKIVRAAATTNSEEELLSRAAREVATHLGTNQFAILSEPTNAKAPGGPSMLFGEQLSKAFPPEYFWAEAQTPLRFSSGDTRILLTGARPGGRRHLSEDLEEMRRLSSVIVEQVERFRAEELKRLVSQAELRALQAQINPHFFFNALNTLYGTIDRGSHEARRMVLNLAEIFRYFLQGDRAFIPLSEELRIVEAYLQIEALRLGDRLETELVVSEAARSAIIPILSIQPLVENAVRHGIAAKRGRGRVCLTAEKTTDGVRITVEDTGVGFPAIRTEPQNGTQMGLENVRRRLALCYGPVADLDIRSSAAGTIVAFFIPNRSYEPKTSAQIEVEA